MTLLQRDLRQLETFKKRGEPSPKAMGQKVSSCLGSFHNGVIHAMYSIVYTLLEKFGFSYVLICVSYVFICFHMFSYVFSYVFSHVFIWFVYDLTLFYMILYCFLYDFIWFSYDLILFYMVLYGFHMILHCFYMIL